MSKVNDLTGQRFGRLVVAGRNPTNAKSGNALWICKCDCGGETVTLTGSLKSSGSTSCGCYKKESTIARFTTHGLHRSSEYNIWYGIKARCYDHKHMYFHNYGGKGVTMSDEWLNSFETFYKDMGPRPSLEHTIDREDGNLGYSKGNCRWATRIEQANNTNRNVYYEFDGERKTLSTWCRELNVNYKAMHNLLKKGLTFFDASDKLVREGRIFLGRQDD